MESVVRKHWRAKPEFSSYLFWDTDLSQLDFARHADFVIPRVFDLGTIDDLAELTAYYGREHVAKSLISAPSLRESSVNLASVLFHIPRESFRCYTSTPSPLRS